MIDEQACKVIRGLKIFAKQAIWVNLPMRGLSLAVVSAWFLASGNVLAQPGSSSAIKPAITPASASGNPATSTSLIVPANPAHENVVRVGPGRAIRTIGEAARQAKNGDVVEIDAGDYAADVAVWSQDNLTIRAFNGRVRLLSGGAVAEGKGIWVVRGGKITAQGFDFIGARSANKNGAGIRFEKGHLIIHNCTFTDNENGILTAGGSAHLEVRESEFDRNGTVDGFGHSIYAGKIDRLDVVGTYIHHAVGGHLLKSRAAENHVVANRLSDEIDGHASYELEFPNGGLNYVIGNVIEQNPSTDNPSIVAVGLEGYQWPRNELYLVNNTVANDRSEGGNFLNVKAGIGKIKVINNLWVGPGTVPSGPASDFANNLQVDWDQFMLASRYDYRLRPNSLLLGKISVPGSANGVDLTQRLEYVHPSQTRALKAIPTAPGAMQTN